MQSETKLFDYKTYSLLMKIKESIFPGIDQYNRPISELAIEVVKSIVNASDELKTPIYRNGHEFIICCGKEQFIITKRGMKQYMVWISRHMGLPETIAVDPEFLDQLFAKAWRYFSQD